MNAAKFLQKPRSERLSLLDQSAPARFMTRHELTLDAAVDTVLTNVLVIAEMDADGEFTAVKITKVRI